jgi:hypothetical protein
MKFLVGETDVPGENLPGSSLFTANPTWPDTGSNRFRTVTFHTIFFLQYTVALSNAISAFATTLMCLALE